MTFAIATFYKLVPLPEFTTLRDPWKSLMLQQAVKGTVLLTPEGVNGTIAGPVAGVEVLLGAMKNHPSLSDLSWKTSFAPTNPFQRSKVKLKREVIPLGHPVQPDMAGTYVKPAQWNTLIENPDVIVVDTRNDYEVKIGQFSGAKNPATRTFRDLPAWLAKNLPADRQTPIAMYCTGGIRCEKSTAYLREQGYENVYHLEGGILKYLEEVPAEQSLWQGDCYVFDDRVAVDHHLQPAQQYSVCATCNNPVYAGDWRRDDTAPCEYCRTLQ